MRMNTIGFWSPCYIDFYKENKLLNHTIQTDEVQPDKAQLSFVTKWSKEIKGEVFWESDYFPKTKMTSKDKTLKLKVTIANPILWWPKGHGSQHMYKDTWVFTNGQGDTLETKQVLFGIRTTQLIQEKDSIGTSYEINVNGSPIFCKGANYIPQEVFPSKVTSESIAKMMESRCPWQTSIWCVFGEEDITQWMNFMLIATKPA